MIYKLILVFLASQIMGCSVCDNEEIFRETSADKVVDAVVIKANCGATTSYVYKVAIVPFGEEVLDNYVFLADKPNWLEVHWVENKQLSITYNEARIFQYTNFWRSSKVDNFNYIVNITENKNQRDSP